MTMVDDEQLVLDRGAASWREVDGEVVVLNLASSEYLSLNGSGSMLWPLLAEGTTVERMADQLVSAFGIQHERAVSDARAFALSVAEQQLLAAVTAAAR